MSPRSMLKDIDEARFLAMKRGEMTRELEALDAEDEIVWKAESAQVRRRMVLRLLGLIAICGLTVPVIGIQGAITLFVGVLLVVGLAAGAFPGFLILGELGGSAADGRRNMKPDGTIGRLVRA